MYKISANYWILKKSWEKVKKKIRKIQEFYWKMHASLLCCYCCVFLAAVVSNVKANDFDVFCELVSLSPKKDWCPDCRNPCATSFNKSCQVTCDDERITGIVASQKGLTEIPSSIWKLTSLTYLYKIITKTHNICYLLDTFMIIV